MTRLNYSNRDAIKLEIDIDYTKLDKEEEEWFNKVIGETLGV
jgi:hypothetical protein